LALRNLLLTKQDGQQLVKVGDFGLSRITQAEDDGEDAEQVYITEHQLLLPIKWVAPEAALTRHFSTRSDVWSFGIVMWEMFSYGATPYQGVTPKQVLQKLHTGYRLEKPHACPDAIYRLMLDCWHELPQKRPTFRSIYDHLLQIRDTLAAATATATTTATTTMQSTQNTSAAHNANKVADSSCSASELDATYTFHLRSPTKGVATTSSSTTYAYEDAQSNNAPLIAEQEAASDLPASTVPTLNSKPPQYYE
jgi:receptor tyrosine kinase-like orphan receptor 1